MRLLLFTQPCEKQLVDGVGCFAVQEMACIGNLTIPVGAGEEMRLLRHDLGADVVAAADCQGGNMDGLVEPRIGFS